MHTPEIQRALEYARTLAQRPDARLCLAFVGETDGAQLSGFLHHVAADMAHVTLKKARDIGAPFIVFMGPMRILSDANSAVLTSMVNRPMLIDSLHLTVRIGLDKRYTHIVWLNLIDDPADRETVESELRAMAQEAGGV